MYSIENNIITFNTDFTNYCETFFAPSETVYMQGFKLLPLPAAAEGNSNTSCLGFQGSHLIATSTTASAFGLATDPLGTRFSYNFSNATGTLKMIVTLKKVGSTYSRYWSFIPAPIPDYTGLDFDSQTNTRFLTATGTATSGYPTFNITYFLDMDEISTTTPALFPQNIRVRSYQLYSTSTTVYESASHTITPLTQGQHSYIYESLVFHPDGTYTALVDFTNTYALFGGTQPFPRSQMDVNFTIAGGIVTEFSVVAVDTTKPSFFTNRKNLYRECSLTALDGCFVNAALFLVTPSEDSFVSLTTLISDSPVPFVSEAYAYYEAVESALGTPQSASTTLTYTLKIPDAGIDVVMFSAEMLTQNLGPAGPYMRGIALVVLYMGFLAMIITTIMSKISVSTTTDTYTDRYGNRKPVGSRLE